MNYLYFKHLVVGRFFVVPAHPLAPMLLAAPSESFLCPCVPRLAVMTQIATF